MRPTGAFAAGSTLPTGAAQGFAFFHPRIPRIPRYDSYRYQAKRLGLSGSIQWQPSDATLVSLEALYAKFTSERSEQYFEPRRGRQARHRDPAWRGRRDTNSVVSGAFNNVDVCVESRFDRLTTKFQQYTGSLRQEFGGRARTLTLGNPFVNPTEATDIDRSFE